MKIKNAIKYFNSLPTINGFSKTIVKKVIIFSKNKCIHNTLTMYKHELDLGKLILE